MVGQESEALRRPRRAPYVVPLIGMGLFCLVVGLAYYSYDEIRERAAANKATALTAGFADYDDMQAAASAGIHDSIAWHAKLAATKAKAKAEADQAEAAKAKAESERLFELAERTRPAVNRMQLSNFVWEKSGFDNVAIVSVTVTNKNDFPVKDIIVACDFRGSSGTTITKQVQVIYDAIPAMKTKKFNKINFGLIHSQAARADCQLAGATRT
jgi:hypothetical protein